MKIMTVVKLYRGVAKFLRILKDSNLKDTENNDLPKGPCAWHGRKEQISNGGGLCWRWERGALNRWDTEVWECGSLGADLGTGSQNPETHLWKLQ